jgi:hypothetical protein
MGDDQEPFVVDVRIMEVQDRNPRIPRPFLDRGRLLPVRIAFDIPGFDHLVDRMGRFALRLRLGQAIGFGL